MIADTWNWLTGRQVLISPYALIAVDKEAQYITVNLTKDQIENSPSIYTDESVSKQFEDACAAYYEWPMYYGGLEMWGAYGSTTYMETIKEDLKESTQDEKKWDHHLRSTHSVSGYKIQAKDGELGHVDDFIIDDETWAIRYLVVDTRNWWPGKKILISPEWIESVSWEYSKVFVNHLRETIKQAPEYTEESLITRDYEIELYKHYNWKGYWD